MGFLAYNKKQKLEKQLTLSKLLAKVMVFLLNCSFLEVKLNKQAEY